VKITFPDESSHYRTARAGLLEMEIALRRQMEAVAQARRALPPGGLVPEDYVFDEWRDGAVTQVKLSELVAPKHRSLLVYNMMFPRHPRDTRPGPTQGETARLPLAEAPCPSCAALLDQLEGAADHVAQKASFVVVAKAPIARVAAFARERGWKRLRLVSSAHNAYNRDYHGENENGEQMPMLNVFSREPVGIRHFWGSELLFAPADPKQDPRHVGTLEPLWNLFDLTREGRDVDWDEQLHYAARSCDQC